MSLYRPSYKIKFLTFAVIFSMIASVFSSLSPEKTYAQGAGFVPVWDQPNAPIQNKTMLSTTMLEIKNMSLDTIAWMAAKMLVRQITASTVDWINSGFNGSPMFIQDPEQFFMDVGDRTAGAIIEKVAPYLCEPFRLNLSISLATGQNRQRDIGCTLSDVVQNMQGFVDGDFSQGGWAGWFEMTQNSQNNPYGAEIAIKAEIAGAQGKKISLLNQQLLQGDGFFDQMECEEGFLPGEGDPEEEHCWTVTPGKVIERQLGSALGSDLRQLELADSFNEILGALAGQLVKQALGGIGGLAGASRGGASGGQSVIRQLQDSNYQARVDAQAAENYEKALAERDSSAPTPQDTDNTDGTPVNMAYNSDYTNQSGTYLGFASKGVVDGIGDNGVIGQGTVGGTAGITETMRQPNTPWWQIDLRGPRAIEDIIITPVSIWTGQSIIDKGVAIGSARVFVSNNPFPETYNTTTTRDPFNPLLSNTWPAGTIYYDLPSSGTGQMTVHIGKVGRYIRIQRTDLGDHRLWLGEVKVLQNTAPVISLFGNNPMIILAGSNFSDPGFRATDKEDGDVSGRVQVTGTVNPNVIGSYNLLYDVLDSGGAKSKQVIRAVKVQ